MAGRLALYDQQLVKGHPRSVGAKHSARVQARTPQGTCTTCIPQRGNYKHLPRAKTHSQGPKMLRKGALINITPKEASPEFYSSLFLVPKKDGGMRPVVL